MNNKKGYIYFLTDTKNSILYIGVTSNLIQRIVQHKNKEIDGFTKRYSIDKLVYYEEYSTITEAIQREKQLKNWHREWKRGLIEKNNPQWSDLYSDLI